MRACARRAGFSLIEVMVAVAIIGVLVALGSIASQSWGENQRASGAARNVANLLLLARAEAIRTGTNHLVFFSQDAANNALTAPGGGAVAVLVVADANGDGAPQTSEYVASMPFDPFLNWGSVFAANEAPAVPPPNDNPAASFPEVAAFACCSFTRPGGAAARWVAFMPDGTPRAFSVGPFAAGPIASGNGSIFINNNVRDYATVMSPLGGVRVHVWNNGAAQWRR